MTAVTPEEGSLDMTLLALGDSVTPVAGMEDLVSSARGAFQLIEPWCHATSSSNDSYHVKDVIVEVKRQTAIYLNALDMSIQISQDGVGFAEDAISLCEFLGRDTPSEFLLRYIDDLMELANKTHQHAQIVVDLFRSSRRGLFHVVTHMIAHNVAELQREARRAERFGKNLSRFAFVAAAIAKTADQVGTNTGVINSVVPLAAIILPFVLPLVSLAAREIEERCTLKSQARALRVISYTDAQSQLETINRDMVALLGHVTAFVDWWSNAVTSLHLIKKSITQFGSSGIDQRRVVTIMARWTAVKSQYQSYGSEISKLQDFYPNLPRENASPISALLPQRASNPDQSYRRINLVLTVSSLAGHMDKCRVAFDKLQKVSTNLRRQNATSFREKLNEMKSHLKLECEKLLIYMEEILAFSDNVEAHPSDGDIDSIENYHDIVWPAAVELLNTAQDIVVMHRNSQEIFSSHKEKIAKLLFKSASSEDKGSSYRPGNSDDPRGLLSNLETALFDIGLSLDNLVTFWHDRSAALRIVGYIPDDGVDKETTSVHIIKDPTYIDQTTITSSVKSITLLFDALVVTVGSAKSVHNDPHRPRK